jgi:hypothetical protein
VKQFMMFASFCIVYTSQNQVTWLVAVSEVCQAVHQEFTILYAFHLAVDMPLRKNLTVLLTCGAVHNLSPHYSYVYMQVIVSFG